MNPERWQAIGELFEKALELPTAERASCVERESRGDEELRREVMSLIANSLEAQGGFFQQKIKSAVLSFHEFSDQEDIRIGPYRLIRELGRGGMGTVFLAERDDDQYKSTVAIKLVRPGMDTDFVLARFKRERQTLARLQHPNIARLLDGGTTESGLPYIVMEYIDGVPVTTYVQEQNLDVTQRVRLFLDICSAVDYAHRNFVVHRDLKPGNILVDRQGVPKLLDFGICKLLSTDPASAFGGGETQTGLMTPSYASPEQIRGEAVGLLSDVYSLGVVLYELLAGRRPHQPVNQSPQEFARSITDGRIALPSSVAENRSIARRLTGDLDNIVLHALETEPQRRYETAALLSDDLDRYLNNKPVRARRQTARYRAYKFARRHVREIAAVCVLFVALAGGLAVSLREARIADARLAQVRELANKLIFDVHDSVKDLPGSTRSRQLIAQTAITYLDSTAKTIQGDVQAELELASAYRRLGDVQGNAGGARLGESAAALGSYKKSMALLDEVLRSKPSNMAAQTERLVLYQRIGALQAYTGKLSDAAQTLQTGINLGRPLSKSGDNAFKAALAGLYIELGDAKRNSGNDAGSLEDAEEAVRLAKDVQSSGTAKPEMLQTLANADASAGMAELKLGRLKDALGRFRESTDLMEQLAAADAHNASLHRELMLAYGHLGDVLGNPNLENLGDRAAALNAYQRAAEIGKGLQQADPANEQAGIDYAISLSRVATVMPDDEFRAKAAAHEASLQVLQQLASKNPTNLSTQMYIVYGNQQLGDTLRQGGDSSGAEKAYSEAVGVADAARKSGQIAFTTLYLMSSSRLGQIYAAEGDRSRALSSARQAYEACTNLPKGAVSPFLVPRGFQAWGLTYAALAHSRAKQSSDKQQAVEWLHKSLNAWRETQKLPSFGAPHQREMHEVETTLAGLEHK